ncbi:MAG TPA: hypothetical protein VNX01_02190 [Bacteroidia bacterium]|jgi:antitoxin component YwqK of YwqJK toxin-antitoxin module|nr:hypothetical protein [Bacteroidia bacterium]
MKARQLITLFLLFGLSYGLFAQGKDTINIIDKNGLKQGRWIVFGNSKPNACYMPNQKVEEGYYYNNKKGGIWYEYFCDNEIKNIIEYKDGRPNGACETFHENGAINEKGTFALNKWIGEYKLHYESGKLQQVLNFNDKGKLEGFQKYYFPNGKLQVISILKNNFTYASMNFDTLGKLVSTGLNGKVIKEGDKITDEDKKIIDSMKEIAAKENKESLQPKTPSKKQQEIKPNIQDINFKRDEIQKKN